MDIIESVKIKKIMKKLKISVYLVKVSYAASYGFPCSTNILEIILEFQKFIKTSKEGDFDYAIKLIRSTSKIADIMANEAKNMSILAKNLAEKSSNTLLMANHNRNEVVDKEKRKTDILKSDIDSFGKNINELQKKVDDVVEREKNKSILDKIINIFINDQSNYKLESEFLKQKAELQEKERKSKSELAGKLKELELLVHTKNDLETSLACMDTLQSEH
ncbi:hypothetical protein ACTFIR_004763 [Dictyostelium discoideum]